MTLKQLLDSQTETKTVPLSHNDLALKIGVHVCALSHWYNGHRKITPRNADKIAKALGVRAVIRAGEIRFERK